MSPSTAPALLVRVIAGAVVVLAVAAGAAVPGRGGETHPGAGRAAAAPGAVEAGADPAAVEAAAGDRSPAVRVRAGPVARGPSGGGAATATPVSSRLGAAPAASGRVTPRWRWPFDPRPRVARPFRAPASDWGAGHRGLDLLSSAAATVLAVEDGRVRHAGVVAGRGTVTVAHVDGLLSTYEPVRPDVAVGDRVAVGDALGRVEPGATSHCGAAVCLHLGARRERSYLDPWPLLMGGELALLPLR